jgi:hypothetical protein
MRKYWIKKGSRKLDDLVGEEEQKEGVSSSALKRYLPSSRVIS